MKNKIELKADIQLVVVAIIWGSGFIATEYAIQANMSVSLIMVMRFSVAALILILTSIKQLKLIKGKELKHGIIAGCILFLAFYAQTIGQSQTTVSNSAFITATNVIMVPFIVWIMTRKRPPAKSFILAVVTLLGVGILTISPKNGLSSFNFGDLMIFVCAVGFALHIAYLEIAVKSSSAKIITLIQITTAAILSSIVLVIFDLDSFYTVNWESALPAVLYLGIFSTCICYFMQTSAQKHTTASKTGIILSMEGFFGTLFSVILSLEPLTAKIIVGGAIILSAVILTEVDIKSKHKNKV
ncbi:transporter [Vallitalea longa]|uniref:Transporter n=1 Tax=Vallitalea longa TaxID=2936439 RepID=A0A9W5YC92_9FIRM|nr:DMT family transporter [Vallitalea longa]GKX29289.1 transporter [Vallitalea longa]